jgi:hypothetical protein
MCGRTYLHPRFQAVGPARSARENMSAMTRVGVGRAMHLAIRAEQFPTQPFSTGIPRTTRNFFIGLAQRSTPRLRDAHGSDRYRPWAWLLGELGIRSGESPSQRVVVRTR